MEIPNRSQLNSEAVQSFEKLSQKHKLELRRYLGNPPDLSRLTNVPASFWAKVKRENEEELLALLLLIFMVSSTFHGTEEGDISTRETGLLWASQRAASESSRYVNRTLEMFDNRLAEIIIRAETGEVISQKEIDDLLDKIFNPSRAAEIATTNVTAGQTQGGEYGTSVTSGLSEDDWWDINPHIHREGPCPVCAPLHGQPRRIWEASVPWGAPAHGHCRCTIRYAAIDGPYDPGLDGVPVGVGALG